MTDGNTPQGTALSSDEGAKRISALFSTPKEQPEQPKAETTPAKAEPVAQEPIEEATTDDVSDDDTSDVVDDVTDAPEPEPESEPVRYRLSDGTEVTADEIEEWRRGTLRQSDYTRKTQEAAKEKKAAEELKAHLAEQQKFYESTVPVISEVLKARMPSPPDPAMMREDPLGYMEAKDAYERAVSDYQSIVNAYQQHQERIAAETKAEQERRLHNAKEQLLVMLPELRAPERMKEFQDKLVQNIVHYGYEPQDLNGLEDPRMVAVLKDAIAYRELKASQPKAISKAKDAAPVQVPGKRSSPQEAAQKAKQERLRQLRKTGDRNVGQSLIRDLLERSSR